MLNRELRKQLDILTRIHFVEALHSALPRSGFAIHVYRLSVFVVIIMFPVSVAMRSRGQIIRNQ